VAHPARVYDYRLGGTANFEADRVAAEQVIKANPLVLVGVRANRAFLRRALEFLAGQAGVRQFLDLGAGLPTVANTHDVVQGVDPACRVVYVDNDPLVYEHGSQLLGEGGRSGVGYVRADVRDVDVDAVLAGAGQVLDLREPVAVMALTVLQYIPDVDAAQRWSGGCWRPCRRAAT
jgi:hypothetical protein